MTTTTIANKPRNPVGSRRWQRAVNPGQAMLIPVFVPGAIAAFRWAPSGRLEVTISEPGHYSHPHVRKRLGREDRERLAKMMADAD